MTTDRFHEPSELMLWQRKRRKRRKKKRRDRMRKKTKSRGCGRAEAGGVWGGGRVGEQEILQTALRLMERRDTASWMKIWPWLQATDSGQRFGRTPACWWQWWRNTLPGREIPLVACQDSRGGGGGVLTGPGFRSLLSELQPLND